MRCRNEESIHHIINLLFFWVDCILSHIFLSGEKRDCSHPIWWLGCVAHAGESVGSETIKKRDLNRERNKRRGNSRLCLDKGEYFCNVTTVYMFETFLLLFSWHSLAGQSWNSRLVLVQCPFLPCTRRSHSTNQLMHLTLSHHKKVRFSNNICKLIIICQI